MDDEFYFRCEICGKNFPADPNTMLECSTNFKVIDEETGKTVEVDEEFRKKVFEEISRDPVIAPFIKGTVCMCIDCQNDWMTKAAKEQKKLKSPRKPRKKSKE